MLAKSLHWLFGDDVLFGLLTTLIVRAIEHVDGIIAFGHFLELLGYFVHQRA
jgi:hypothetical protein